MPIFEIEGPGGSRYEVEAPDEDKALAAFKGLQAEEGDNQGSILAPIAQGITFGFSDEISGLGGAARALISGEDAGEGYATARDAARERLGNYRERNPVTATAAEIGGAVLPALATGGASLAGRGLGTVARGALLATEGAGAGAVYGFGAGEGSAGERAKNAGIGAGAGAIGGVAAPLVGRAVGAAAKPIVSAMRGRAPSVAGASRGAVKRVVGGMADDAIETPADLAARRINAGPEGRLYNAGENLRTHAETLVQRPGPQMRTITEAAKQQTSGSGARVRSALDSALGKEENVTKAFDDMVANRKQVADRMYGEARRRAKPVDVSRVIDHIDEEILPRELATDLRDDSINATLRRIRDFFGTDKNTRFGLADLHKVKVELDGMIGEAVRGGNNAKAGALKQVQKQLLDAMDEASPIYRRARSTFAGDIAVQNAMEEGQSVFSKTMRSTELAKKLAGMSEVEKAAFRRGARDQVAQMMDNALPNLAENADAQAVWKRLQTEENLRKMRLLLGGDAADRIQSTLKREWRLSSDANTMLANSATGRRLAAKDLYPDPNKAPSFPTAPSAYGRLESVIGGLSKVGGKAVQGGNKRLNADAARLLGLPIDDPAIDALLNAQRQVSRGEAAGVLADQRIRGLANTLRLPAAAGAASTSGR